MLTLTDNAADVIRGIVDSADEELPAETGLRISTEVTDGQGAQLSISVVGGPQDGDDTIEENGALVYLSSKASLLLHDKVLDAQAHEDHVHFTIGEQEA